MTAQRTISIETWGSRTTLVILPRTVDKPSRTFKSGGDALAAADQLRRQHGWPIQDRRL